MVTVVYWKHGWLCPSRGEIVTPQPPHLRKSRKKVAIVYLRPVKLEELTNWLLTKGYAEEKPGYGHVDAETLAKALIEKFDVLIESPRM